MPELVQVSSVDNLDKLKAQITDHFQKGKYSEITQSIGMYSILIDAEHMIQDQVSLYHMILDLLKNRISRTKGAKYGAWYTAFPSIMDGLITRKTVVTDQAAIDVMSSHRDAFGPFRSVDDFFFWALDDRRLTLGQTVKYIEKTAELAS